MLCRRNEQRVEMQRKVFLLKVTAKTSTPVPYETYLN